MPFDLNPTRVPASQDRPHQRHPRALFSAPVMFRHLAVGGFQSWPGISLDLSQGGLGAIVQSGLRVGEMVEIEVRAPGLALSAVAIVRYTSTGRCGFEFVGLTFGGTAANR